MQRLNAVREVAGQPSAQPRGVLMYHDVIVADPRESGFVSAGADTYKLNTDLFGAHLAALALAFPAGPQILSDASPALSAAPFLLTFDDGGVSAATEIAPRLESLGWRGHFFVTTDRIDTPGFLSAQQIRALHVRGHVIGTHSASHPLILSDLSTDALVQEWRHSSVRLADIIGAPVRIGSVPGGYNSPRVIAAAAQAGIRLLFTSDPSVRVAARDGVQLIGRYALQHTSPAAEAVALAGGSRRRQLVQWWRWSALKIAKAGFGSSYPRLRNRLLQWHKARIAGPI